MRGSLQAERPKLPFPGISRPVKITFICDMHFDGDQKEGSLPAATMRKAIQLSNAFAPDFVVFGGDYVHTDPGPASEITPYLPMFRAPFGRYAVEGNHDHLAGRVDLIDRALERSGP